MSDSKVKRYGVIGAARSGLAVARLLRSEGKDVLVSDRRPASEMPSAVEFLQSIGARFELGAHTEALFDNDEIVLSPGVPDTIPIVVEARRRGITITNELEVAARRCRGEIVAITGTNGKTTTTELSGHIFRMAGRKTWVAGNVGVPFSEIAPMTTQDDVVVVEASSFQLEHIETFHPRVAVILNVTPDHMDRYAAFEDYVAAKERITMRQTDHDMLIYNIDDPVLRGLSSKSRAYPLALSIETDVEAGAFLRKGMLILRFPSSTDREFEEVHLMRREEIAIRGPHNLYNAMAAALAARALGVQVDAIREGLATFAGVPHRLESVGEVDGVRFVNDSKATNVNSLWYALQSFSEPIVLIAGGRSKRNQYGTVLPLLRQHVRAVVLIGEAADEMEKAFSGIVATYRAGFSLEEAMRIARELALPNDIVLLSPACASFDMFENYEHRGDVFKAIVRELRMKN